MLKLGVNVDHVATLRQARRAQEPDPVAAAHLCEESGAWGITAHLREDRRHINDTDMERLAKTVRNLNMEMALTDEMLQIALKLKPHSSCLVPEKRLELTTEGGLDVVGNFAKITDAVKILQDNGIIVSLFIDPDFSQIEKAAESGANYIELHTGTYANSEGKALDVELDRLIAGAKLANTLGLKVNAGHGIGYENIRGIMRIPYLQELNIGHSIVSRAIFCGIGQAVADMVGLMSNYQGGEK